MNSDPINYTTGEKFMTATEKNRAARNILDKLIEHNSDYRWDAQCTYADGAGTTILEILIFSQLGRSINGRISYLVETGKVINYHYKGMYEEKPEDIIDLLLDIFHFETMPISVDLNKTKDNENAIRR